MASDRPFPPSTRRLARARAAGLTPASPIVVGAAACIGAVVALSMAGHAMFSRLAVSIRSALDSADGTARVLDPAASANAAGSALDVAASANAAGSALDAAASANAAGSALDAAASANAAGSALDAAASAHAAGSALDSAGGSTLADTVAGAAGIDAREIVSAIIALALPVLGAIAIAAVLAHLAQTRALWIPRRRLPDAPVEDPQRGTRGAIAITNAVVIALVAIVWLYAMAPRLAALVTSGVLDGASHAGNAGAFDGASSAGAFDSASRAGSAGAFDSGAWGAGALLVVSFLAALAIAWVALGAIDALVRFAAHTSSLRMTHEEQRADARLAGADPRWRARREKLARGEPVRDAVAGASVLVLGDGVAVAVAWDPVRRPVPTRTASGKAARATQMLGLARRHAIAVHRDAELATLLAIGEGPVPEAHWPRLAEIVAAVRGRR